MQRIFQFLLIFSAVIICTSCNPDEIPEQTMEGTWDLVEIRGHWTPVLSGEDLSIRETYTFHPNGTFTKSRVGAEFDHYGSGTFTLTVPDPTIEGNENVRYEVDLIFNTNVSTDIIYGCNIGPEEFRDSDEEFIERMYLRDDGLLRNWGCYRIADLSLFVYSKK
ncbi:MAG TPA: hypothetical protein VK921_04535 [Anditalea sp.]|nr:hypothetical protein [Anditalea sp.]